MAKKQEKIKLLKNHTHAGRDYAPGDELLVTLPGEESDGVAISQQDAGWLASIGVAEFFVAV